MLNLTISENFLGWWVAGTEKEARPGWGPSSQLGAISFYEKEIIQGFYFLRAKRFSKKHILEKCVQHWKIGIQNLTRKGSRNAF